VDSSTTIDTTIDDDVEVIDGLDPPTVVDIVPPAAISGKVRSLGSSEVRFSGDTVGGLWASDSSTIAIYGGEIGRLFPLRILPLEENPPGPVVLADGVDDDSHWFEVIRADGSSTINMCGGSTLYQYVFSHVVPLGSSIPVIPAFSKHPDLVAYDSAEINFFGGEITGIEANDGSTVNLHGGRPGVVIARASSTVNLHGGDVPNRGLYSVPWSSAFSAEFQVLDQSVLHVFGYDLESQAGRYVGTLEDYTPLIIDVAREQQRQVELHELTRAPQQVVRADRTIDQADPALAEVIVRDGPSQPTTLQIGAGARIWELDVKDSSVASMSGGTVRTQIRAGDTSQVSFSGGRVFGGIWADASSSVDISGGLILGESAAVTADGQSVVNIRGGYLDSNEHTGLAARGSSTTTISGGVLEYVRVGGSSKVTMLDGRISILYCEDASTVELAGGDPSGFRAGGSSRVSLSGGWFSGSVRASDSARVDVYGYGLGFADGLLTGRLTDYSRLQTSVVLGDTAEVILHEMEQPAPVVLDRDATIDSSDAYRRSRVHVVDGPTGTTEVSIVDGAKVGYLSAQGSSVVEQTGGLVNLLEAAGDSRVTQSGGLAGTFRAMDGSHAEISGGTIRDRLEASGQSTVAVSGGSIAAGVTLSGQSSVTLTGGSVGGRLESCDQSTLTISADLRTGAFWGEPLYLPLAVNVQPVVGPWVTANDQSTVKLSGTARIDSLTMRDSASLDMAGGYVYSLDVRGTSRAEISDGRVRYSTLRDAAAADVSGGSFRDFSLYGQATAEFSGGTFYRGEGYLKAADQSEVRLFAGRMPYDVFLSGSATMHVYGYNLALTDWLLTGTLTDYSTLYHRPVASDGTQIVLHQLDEPDPVLLDAPTTIDEQHSYPGQRVEVVDKALSRTVVSIEEGAKVGYLSVQDSSIVNFTGGETKGLEARESGVVNFVGGQVRDHMSLWGDSTVNYQGYMDYTTTIEANDNSTLNLSEGSAGDIVLNDASALNVSNGSFQDITVNHRGKVSISGMYRWAGHSSKLTANGFSTVVINVPGMSSSTRHLSHLTANDSSTVVIADGRLGVVAASGNSYLDVLGGVFTRLQTYGSSVADVSGGSLIGYFDASGAYESSVWRLSGGWIDDNLTAADSAVIHVYGYDLDLAGDVLTGVLADYSRIRQTVHVRDSAQVILHEIPEQPSVVIDHATTLDAANSYPRRRVEIVDGPSGATPISVVDGASIGRLQVRGSSMVDYAGGRTNDLEAGDSAVIKLTGGTIHDISARSQATLSFFDGTFAEVLADGQSVVSVHGGEFQSQFVAAGSCSVNIFGGTFRGRLTAKDFAEIHVFGRDLEIIPGRLQGSLADGTSLYALVDTLGHGQIVLHNIPEPSTLAGLFGAVAVLLLARARKRRKVMRHGVEISLRGIHRR